MYFILLINFLHSGKGFYKSGQQKHNALTLFFSKIVDQKHHIRKKK